jgi:hypothetical protein
MNLAIGIRLQFAVLPGSMGVVTDTLFVNCYWPKLDRPTRIFAPGSSGIRVMGTTPRNVWFPDDVVFETFYPDALYPAECAVKAAFPFKRIGLVNLSPAEAQVWLDAYRAAAASFPPTHTAIVTQRNTNFLRHREEVSRRTITLAGDSVDASGAILHAGARLTKIQYEEYVAALMPGECVALMDGKADEAAMRAEKTFVHLSLQNPDKSPVTLEQARAKKIALVESVKVVG